MGVNKKVCEDSGFQESLIEEEVGGGFTFTFIFTFAFGELRSIEEGLSRGGQEDHDDDRDKDQDKEEDQDQGCDMDCRMVWWSEETEDFKRFRLR